MVDVSSRFAELEAWFETENTGWLLNSFLSTEMPAPYLYPFPDGVRAEWVNSDYDISLDIDTTTKEAYWHVLHRKTNKEDARDFNFDDPLQWEEMSKLVCQLIREGSHES